MDEVQQHTQSFFGRCREKLKSRAGESIAETLVALLIAALSLVMLAGAIASASGMITKTRAKLDEYYTAANNLADRATAKGTVNITIENNDGIETVSIPGISYYENSVFDHHKVIAYKK